MKINKTTAKNNFESISPDPSQRRARRHFPWISLCICLLSPIGVAFAQEPTALSQDEFNAPAGELRGSGDWTSRDGAIVLSGKGMACPGSGKADGYVKRPLTMPPGVSRVRLSARVVVSPLPGSDARLHHTPGEKPSWIAIGFGRDPNTRAGLSGVSLVMILSRNDGKLLVGLGKSAGSGAPALGSAEMDAANPVELVLDYRFSDSTATVSTGGKEILRASQSLKPDDFRVLMFQLRRMQSATDPQTGGIESLQVEAWPDAATSAPATVLKTAMPAVPSGPLGSRPDTPAKPEARFKLLPFGAIRSAGWIKAQMDQDARSGALAYYQLGDTEQSL